MKFMPTPLPDTVLQLLSTQSLVFLGRSSPSLRCSDSCNHMLLRRSDTYFTQSCCHSIGYHFCIPWPVISFMVKLSSQPPDIQSLF
jgi:hypothetical protein